MSFIPYLFTTAILVAMFTFASSSKQSTLSYGQLINLIESKQINQVQLTMNSTVIDVKGTYTEKDIEYIFVSSIPNNETQSSELMELLKEKVTDGNIFFEYSESLVAPNGVHLFPVQGIESFSLFCLFFLLVLLLLKNKNTKTHIIYIIFYSIDRFILEFFRGDIQRGIYGLFSTSQIISLILFFTMISYLFVKRCKKNNF